jgi:hypothetical protein
MGKRKKARQKKSQKEKGKDYSKKIVFRKAGFCRLFVYIIKMI